MTRRDGRSLLRAVRSWGTLRSEANSPAELLCIDKQGQQHGVQPWMHAPGLDLTLADHRALSRSAVMLKLSALFAVFWDPLCAWGTIVRKDGAA
jgi:hypothetical protein